MSFGGLFITNRGRALQAKAQTGVQLNFTKLAVGDGQLSGQSISDLTELIHQIKTLELNKFKTLPGGKAVVGGVLSNQDIVTGFYWRELGVFAQDPDLGEILYCYGNAGDLAEYIPAPGGAEILEKQVDVITLVGNASNVSASIEQSLVYITQGEKGEPGGVASLDDTGKVPAEQLPVIEVPVTSVNSKTGDVVLSAEDVGAETPAGAEAKADAALAAANQYTDQEVGAVAQAQASHEADNTAHVTKDGTIQTGLNAEMVGGLLVSSLQEGKWQKLEEIVLSVDTQQIDITVPEGYQEIRIIGRNLRATTASKVSLRMTLNNDSTGGAYLLTKSTETAWDSRTAPEVEFSYAIGASDEANSHSIDLMLNHLQSTTDMKTIYGVQLMVGSYIVVSYARWNNLSKVTVINLYTSAGYPMSAGCIFEVWGR